MSAYRKALIPVIMIVLPYIGERAGIAPELLTIDVANVIAGFLLAVAGLVYQIPNKEVSK